MIEMHFTGTAEQMHMVEAIVLTIKSESCTDKGGSVFFHLSSKQLITSCLSGEAPALMTDMFI